MMIFPSNCEDCPLKGSQKVYGEGPGECDFVIVGIMPADEELKQGKVYAGQSGFIVRETLKKLDYPPVHLTNALLCNVPEEMDAKDKREAIKCCKDRLFYEIGSVHPKLVIALGNDPLHVLAGRNYNVTEVEGRILPGYVWPVLPIAHPASFLHNMLSAPAKYPDFVDALRVGTKFTSGTYIQVAEPPDLVVVDWENYSELLRHIDKSEVTVVDLETTKRGFFPYDRDADQIRCIAITTSSLMQDGQTSYMIPGHPSPYFEDHPNYIYDPRLKEVLEKSKLIFHNSTFDQGFLWASGFKTKTFFDTFLAHYMLDEREYAHGLKPLAKKYFGAPDWEQDIKVFLPNKKSSYDLIPDDNLYGYAKFDACYTYMLYDEFKEDMDNTIFHSLLMPCANMFSEVRYNGIKIDIGYLAELDDILEKELQAEMQELNEMAGCNINPFSTGKEGDVAWLLFEKLGYPSHHKYGKSTRKEHLRLYADDPIVEKILNCRAAGKLRSTYVSGIVGFLDHQYRVHPLTKIHGAVTGRISTEDPSVMNITGRGGIKKLYIPLNEGHLICEADAKQMELRCYSVIAEDNYLASLLTPGPTEMDPHERVRQEASLRSGRELNRTQAKSCVFGRLYGRHEASFERALNLDRQGVKMLLEVIDSLFPTIPVYNKTIKEDVHDRGYCQSYFNRYRRFPLITWKNKNELYREGANFKVQSMASDINLFCMLHIFALKDKFGIMPMFPVHDSIVMDIADPSIIPELRKEMEEFTSDLIGDRISFKYDFKVGPNWGEGVASCELFNCSYYNKKDKKCTYKYGSTCIKLENRKELRSNG